MIKQNKKNNIPHFVSLLLLLKYYYICYRCIISLSEHMFILEGLVRIEKKQKAQNKIETTTKK